MIGKVNDSVTNLMDNCDKKVNRSVYVFRLTLLHIFIFFTLTSCGAKKKSLDITKEERKEQKDLSVFTQKNGLSVVTFTKDATEMIIETLSNKDLIIGKDTIKGAKSVIYRKTRVDSTVHDTVHETAQVSDKGEVYSSKKEKKMDKEVEGNSSDIKWSIWGVGFILLCGIVIFFILNKKKWFNKFP